MTIGAFLASATSRLKQAGVESARLDTLLILEDSLGIDRALILAHPDQEISDLQEMEMNKKIAQRADHTPMAYVLNHAEFYGRRFKIDRNVLVPRPESEAMINLLKILKLPREPAIADIGTGSGCLGITAALEIEASKIWLCDVSETALNIAAYNSKKLGVKVMTKKTNLLEGLDNLDIVLANLPYVPNVYPINKAAQHEPELALFGGDDGMDIYREFWQQIGVLKPGFVIAESLNLQHEQMTKIALNVGYKLDKSEGLAQQFSQLGQHPA